MRAVALFLFLPSCEVILMSESLPASPRPRGEHIKAKRIQRSYAASIPRLAHPPRPSHQQAPPDPDLLKALDPVRMDLMANSPTYELLAAAAVRRLAETQEGTEVSMSASEAKARIDSLKRRNVLPFCIPTFYFYNPRSYPSKIIPGPAPRNYLTETDRWQARNLKMVRNCWFRHEDGTDAFSPLSTSNRYAIPRAHLEWQAIMASSKHCHALCAVCMQKLLTSMHKVGIGATPAAEPVYLRPVLQVRTVAEVASSGAANRFKVSLESEASAWLASCQIDSPFAALPVPDVFLTENARSPKASSLATSTLRHVLSADDPRVVTDNASISLAPAWLAVSGALPGNQAGTKPSSAECASRFKREVLAAGQTATPYLYIPSSSRPPFTQRDWFLESTSRPFPPGIPSERKSLDWLRLVAKLEVASMDTKKAPGRLLRACYSSVASGKNATIATVNMPFEADEIIRSNFSRWLLSRDCNHPDAEFWRLLASVNDRRGISRWVANNRKRTYSMAIYHEVFRVCGGSAAPRALEPVLPKPQPGGFAEPGLVDYTNQLLNSLTPADLALAVAQKGICLGCGSLSPHGNSGDSAEAAAEERYPIESGLDGPEKAMPVYFSTPLTTTHLMWLSGTYAPPPISNVSLEVVLKNPTRKSLLKAGLPVPQVSPDASQCPTA